MTNKVKITQKEFDDIYQIEDEIIPDKEITEDTPTNLPKEDTTPFLTEEEEEHETEFYANLEEEAIENA